MKNTFPCRQLGGIVVTLGLLLAKCASTTQICSSPSGAAVYCEQQRLGTTPCDYTDQKIVGSSTNFTLKLDGYEDMRVTIVRDEKAHVGAIIGGFFAWPLWLWAGEYKPVHSYELVPLQGGGAGSPIGARPLLTTGGQQSTTELVKLKALLDGKAINEDEFTTLKVAILQGGYDYAHSPADQIAALRDLHDKGLLTQTEYDGQKAKAIDSKGQDHLQTIEK